jgi:hypothetical protein
MQTLLQFSFFAFIVLQLADGACYVHKHL